MVHDRLFADLVVLAHFAFVLFVIAGLPLTFVGRFRQWRWTRSLAFRMPHVAAILFVVLTAWLGVPCPLTVLENELRQRAGQSGYPGDCMGYWLHELLFYDFPAWVFTLLYTLFGIAVLLTFWLAPPRWPRRDLTTRHRRPAGHG